MSKKEMSFEHNLKRLEEIVSKLENNELDLSEALTIFEESQTLIQSCEKDLKSAEQKVKKLIKSSDNDADSFQLELI